MSLQKVLGSYPGCLGAHAGQLMNPRMNPNLPEPQGTAPNRATHSHFGADCLEGVIIGARRVRVHVGQAAVEQWVMGPLGAGHAEGCRHRQRGRDEGRAAEVLAGGAAPQGADEGVPSWGVWGPEAGCGVQGCTLAVSS